MKKLATFWLDFLQTERKDSDWWFRKQELCKERNATIIRIRGEGTLFQKLRYDNKTKYRYLLHVSFFIKQKHLFYVEEQIIPYQFRFVNGEIVEHKEIVVETSKDQERNILKPDVTKLSVDGRFSYDPQAAVKYAEYWWNSYNTDFQKFDVDCTNYVSQCLLAGGAPMRGAPVKDTGWWYQGEKWSFSWAVAHSLKWYLSGSTEGLTGKEVQSANELYPGDVICYDFQGDGRWDHNTIVVTKDVNGMPLVNAHTDNSRHRYWSYEDSTAWTPNIKYKFFRISD